MTGVRLFTSESVSEGHPDKIADQVSDAVLDAILALDPRARVACETLITRGLIVISGEITTAAPPDYAEVARRVLRRIGYDDPALGFDCRDCAVLPAVNRQSPDIARGVRRRGRSGLDQGAGDQGLMFGYACDETASLMPFAIHHAHRIMRRLARQRRRAAPKWLRPDAKCQLTVRYVDGKPEAIDTVVVSAQHDPGVGRKQIREQVIEDVIRPCLPPRMRDKVRRILVNPTGRFVVGGPHGDCGLTGRKIIVDTYGGAARHGGGAFSGKDPSKVDRSVAYALRHVAKNIVAAGLARRCEVQAAYAIGVARPVGLMVETFGTGRIPEERIVMLIRRHFDLRPAAIIEALDLLRPIYERTAAYGHFGRREAEFTWERTDKAEALRADAEPWLPGRSGGDRRRPPRLTGCPIVA